MLNTFTNITKNASLKKRILPCTVFFIMGCVFFYFAKKHGVTPMNTVPAISFLCGAILILIPISGKKIFYIISIITAAINYIFLNTLLIAFYYILFTPLALLIRIFSRQMISRKMDSKTKSMWEEYHTVSDLKQYFKQY